MSDVNIINLKAVVVADEIDINQIATRHGIRRKYTWEEPLVLKGERLQGENLPPDARIYIFAFGTVVFANCSDAAGSAYVEDIRFALVPQVVKSGADRYEDSCQLRIGGETFAIEDDEICVPEGDIWIELAATVLAKSAAMDKVEFKVSSIEDKIEEMLDSLGENKFKISDKKISATTSQILKFEFTSIAYIMILDKPDSVWKNTEAADFYDSLSEFFELNDRYEIFKSKIEILNNIKDGFADMSFTKRGMKLEWAVIWLIIAEVVLMILELLH